MRGGSDSSGVEEPEDSVIIDGRVAGGDQHPGFVDQLGGAAGRDQLEAGAVAGDVHGQPRGEAERFSERLGTTIRPTESMVASIWEDSSSRPAVRVTCAARPFPGGNQPWPHFHGDAGADSS